VDEDGIGYFNYTVIRQDHAIRIGRLTPDFLGSGGQASDVLGRGSEEPALFKHAARYYDVFDSNCCFCPAGSGARVFVASSPLGPYSERSNINSLAGGRPIVAGQQTFVAAIPTPGGTAFIWMADRWVSRPDGMKGHDFQFWSPPLRFDREGSIAPIENVPEWRLSVRIGAERSPNKTPYIWPGKKDPHPLKIDPCTHVPLPPED
jgi:hypothetical protein